MDANDPAVIARLRKLERHRLELNSRANDAFDYSCFDSLELYETQLREVELEIKAIQERDTPAP